MQCSQIKPTQGSRRGFTLVELLMVILLIGILSSFVLVALSGATQSAKEDRTKAQILKIHSLLMEKWEKYEYRRVPSTLFMVARRNASEALMMESGITPGAKPNNRRMAVERLNAMRELMRMELPTYKFDVVDRDGEATARAVLLRDPVRPRVALEPALWRAYRQRAINSAWDANNQQAECLYLILSQMRDGDSSALEFFKETEIGDVDGDGVNEILDAWGNPIVWMLWAPGYISPLQTPMSRNAEQHDSLDLANLGSAYVDTDSNGLPNAFEGTYTMPTDGSEWAYADLPRTLYPLVCSAGPDGKFGIILSTDLQKQGNIDQIWSQVMNDPYARDTPQRIHLLGAADPLQADALADDISNHYLTTR